MKPGPDNRKDLARMLAFAQVGFEIAGPIALGAALDLYWQVTPKPWGVVVGAVLGLAGGLYHLVQLVNQDDRPKPPPAQGPP
jgi:hypothetical protein